MEYQKSYNANIVELYDTFPFIEAFPFKEYNITLEVDDFNPEEIGIHPIIINNVTGLELQSLIHFKYLDDKTEITVSLNFSDIELIKKNSVKIKKLNSTLEIIEEGLNSNSIKNKMLSIKKLNSFLKKILNISSNITLFNNVLIEMTNLLNIKINYKLFNSIQNLNTRINESSIPNDQKEIILMYYNFQLHHAKILLGLVIALKIF